jgi:hypothetical protein
MSKIEDAALRLEAAVTRLERAIERAGERAGERRGDSGGDSSAEGRQLVADLAAAKDNYAALEATTTRVASRLDATISRLNAALGAT